MNCAVCMYTRREDSTDLPVQTATTIANGNAMCEEHFNAYCNAINPSGGGVALSMLYRFDLAQPTR